MSQTPTRKRLQILFVSGSLGSGGSERQLIEILKHLDRERFAPRLFLVYDRGELLPEVPPDVPKVAYWSGRRSPRLNFPGRTLWSQARFLAEQIRRAGIDLVYDRTSHMTLLTSLAMRRLAVPRVSVITADPTLELAASHPRFTAAKRWLLTRAYRSASRVVAVSAAVRAAAIQCYRLPPEQVVTCPSLFDIPALLDKAAAPHPFPDLPASPFEIVSVGRLQAEKGQLLLLQAVELLLREHHVAALRLWLVGDGPDRARLEAFVRERQLGDVVRFTGFLANPLPLVRRAHLFCLPSYFEGLPNALIEAILCRTPVVSTDCPSGPREILAEGELGTLVPPGDPRALADAMHDVRRRPEFHQARTGPAFASIQARYSLASGLQSLESLFAQLTAPRDCEPVRKVYPAR